MNGYKQPQEPKEGDLTDSHTRQNAIEDGLIVDVSGMAKEVGLRYPTAVTGAVWREYVQVPDDVTWQSESDRLRDVLTMLRYGIGSDLVCGKEIRFEFVVHDDAFPTKVRLSVFCHPGDDGMPVITVMLPQRD